MLPLPVCHWPPSSSSLVFLAPTVMSVFCAGMLTSGCGSMPASLSLVRVGYRKTGTLPVFAPLQK